MKPYAIASTFIFMIAVLSTALISIATTACAPNAAPGSSTLPVGTGTNVVVTPSQTDATIEASLPLIRTGAAVATGAVLNFAVKQDSTRTRLANEMYSSASAVYTLTGGKMVTPDQLSKTLTSYGQSGDAQYATYVTALNGLYSSYYAKIPAGDAKTATDVLNAIAGGTEDATASYVSTPAPVTTTEYETGIKFICRMSSRTHPEMLRSE